MTGNITPPLQSLLYSSQAWRSCCSYSAHWSIQGYPNSTWHNSTQGRTEWSQGEALSSAGGLKARLGTTVGAKSPLWIQVNCTHLQAHSYFQFPFFFQNFVRERASTEIWNASQIRVSSSRRGHGRLLCIIPILVYVRPKWELTSRCPSWEQNKARMEQPLWFNGLVWTGQGCADHQPRVLLFSPSSSLSGRAWICKKRTAGQKQQLPGWHPTPKWQVCKDKNKWSQRKHTLTPYFLLLKNYN